ncbi:Phage tail protein [compost metagenome]
METWAELAGFKGNYISQEIPYSFSGTGAITKISWDSIVPDGTSLSIQTALSFNNGYTWSDWSSCINGGSIPQITPITSLKNAKIKYRAIVETDSSSITPTLSQISFDITPVFTINNKGTANCKPEIWITKIGNGDFSIQNTSNNNETFTFMGLVNGETVYVNNERQDIQTSLAVTYRYKDFNDNYLDFPPGQNVLRINGNATIRFRYQFPM